MGALWHPKAVRRIHIDAGGFEDGGRKLVWHTTEGTSLPDYGGSSPHFTLDPADGRLWQHIPLNRAARALMAGGPNFWNTIQVELVGYADTVLAEHRGTPDRAVVNWPDRHYDAIAELARWIEANFGVPRTCGVEFVSHVAHLGTLDDVRRYAGHLGHQHVTGNEHWDPGLLKIELVLAVDAGRALAGAAPREPAAPRDLGRGDHGDDVKALQSILVQRGYLLLRAETNGVFGRGTEACVVHFQWKHGLHVDGVVGEGTRNALGLGAEPSPATPRRGAVTRTSLLIAPPRASAAMFASYICARPHGGYSDTNVRTITGLYEKTATAVGLDPLLVVAQMILETGNLSSEWSQPPRRNPAGIGVTGAPGEGVSFPNWKSAVNAHVGRLLAYSLPSGEETPAQLKLVNAALETRPLPARLRGSASSLSKLAGTWAADKQYATKIVRVANEIVATAV